MIEMRESVPREIMKQEIYPSCDLFLIPSHGEGFPNSMLEAMASGMPIVGSFAGAIPEVIIPPKNGFLNDANDHKGLARDILTLIENKELRLEQGRYNHHLCETTYEIVNLFRRFDTVWQKAMNEK